jgi:hypothetical protein
VENTLEDEPKQKESLLISKPQNIDFGNLHPGMGASATLNIHGGPGRVSVRNDKLKVSLATFEKGDTILEITLLPGNSGELIWDEFILEINTGEWRVPVTARWTEQTAETTLERNIETTITITEKPRLNSKEERTFKGKSCSLCGRNFGYNIDSRSWERCTCSWYQKVGNISSHTYKELRYGVKDIPSYLQELWRIIMGKEKW